ncbi:HAD family hydrolase [Thauera sp. SDU_THAU2]|uniref:HAD family hydrolase n=1 Tax=Thauera sp. SDU_THAU2 TaxID=3136633 RepID=UPI00311DBCDD
MPIHAVLFDLDDTLHDKSRTLECVAREQYAMARLSELRVDLSAWVSHFIALNNERIEKFLVFSSLAAEFSLPPELASSLLHDFDDHLGSKACPFPGARELLSRCREQGLKTGIVTNGRNAFQRSKITGLGLDTLVDVTVTSGELGIKKPDLRIFRTCLEALMVEPAEAAFVGDDFAADMEPAIALGMHAVWKSPLSSAKVAFSSDHLEDIGLHLLGAV